MKDVKKGTFVILDVETTGLSPFSGDRIIEIAALKVVNLKTVDKFYSFVDPQRDLSLGAFEVNRITPQMLKGAPPSKEVLPRFLEFVGDAHLVGHNVGFDLGFITYELSLINLKLKDEVLVIDTLKMAKEVLPNLGRYALWLVARSLGINRDQNHRAMSDVELTYEVFCQLIERLGQRDLSEMGVSAETWVNFRTFPQEGGIFG